MPELGIANITSIKSLFSEYKPAYSNIFTIRAFSGFKEDISNYSTLHATSLTFTGAGITLKRHNVTKLFALSNYQRSDEVTITWREDANFSIRDFHQNWIKKFYDEVNDCYISYSSKKEVKSNLAKDFKVYLPNNITLHLKDVYPQKIPELSLSWETSGIISYSITYYVTSWEWNKE